MVTKKKQHVDHNCLAAPLISKEDGFVLVVTLVVLVVLTLMGIAATHMTQIELLISGNDRVHKDTFYMADSGTELGIRLGYDNAICSQTHDGFKGTGTDLTTREFGNFLVENLNFASPLTVPSPGYVADDLRSLAYYPDGQPFSDSDVHTNLLYRIEVKAMHGSGQQMISGYDGLGASSAAGGTYLEYEIASQHIGERNSETIVTVKWRLNSNIVNSASALDCKPMYIN